MVGCMCMYVYIGPMLPILGALGYKLKKWTPYASLVTMELFESKQESGAFYVLTSYDGEVLTLPEPCDCDANENRMCSWDRFVEFMTPMIPTQEECPGLNPHNQLDVTKDASLSKAVREAVTATGGSEPMSMREKLEAMLGSKQQGKRKKKFGYY